MLNQPLEGLIERVAGAPGPDRFLDAHIRVALEPPADDDFVTDCPFYTSSIDAALGLVERLLPECGWSINGGIDIHDSATVWLPDGTEIVASAATPVLAIILATLRAIQSTKTGGGE